MSRRRRLARLLSSSTRSNFACTCQQPTWHALHPSVRRPCRRATFDELLAAPAGDDAGAPTGTVVRAAAAYASRDERFLIKHKDYDRQYAQLYFYRLLQMRAHVEASARAAWPGISGAAAGAGRGAGFRCGACRRRGVAHQRRRLAPPARSGAHPVGA